MFAVEAEVMGRTFFAQGQQLDPTLLEDADGVPTLFSRANTAPSRFVFVWVN